MNLWKSVKNAISKKTTKQSLATEIATRERSLDFSGFLGVLPNPDPVLKKMGKDITVYRDIKVDAHIRSVIQSRKAGALSREWKVEPGDATDKAKKAAELCEAVLKKLKPNVLIKEILNAPLFGYSVPEVIWANVNGQWLPKKVMEKPQEWFGFDSENRLRFLSRDNMLEGELVPERKFLLVQHDASYINPYGEGVLSSCFWPYVFKKGGMKFWATFTEKYGMPYLIGKLPRGASEPERAALLDQLEQMVQDAVAVIPDDGSVDILSDSNKGSSSDLYDKLIHAMNAEISKAVLGQTLTTEMSQSGGSYSASKTHQEVREDLVDADAMLVADAINTLFDWICQFNMPDAPRPTYETLEEEDLQSDRADRDVKLTKQGLQFSASYYAKTYNLEKDDFKVGPPPTEPAPGKPGASFAEVDPAFTTDRQAMEGLIDAGAATAAKKMETIVEQLVQFVDSVESYDELENKLLELAPTLSIDDTVQVMAQALFVAETWGRLNG